MTGECKQRCPFESDIQDTKRLMGELQATVKEMKIEQKKITAAILGQMTGEQGGLISKVHTMQTEMDRQRKWRVALVSLSISGIVSLIVGLILMFANTGSS